MSASPEKQFWTHLGPRPPNDGREWDAQCAHCGCQTEHTECNECGGDGYVERYEEDPLWYDPDELYPCHQCGGDGGWLFCANTEEWCAAHPLPGREEVRGLEWFTFDRPKAVAS